MTLTSGDIVRQHLVIFAKRPLPNHAKTRLGAEIGCEQAAGVYARIVYKLLIEVAWPRI